MADNTHVETASVLMDDSQDSGYSDFTSSSTSSGDETGLGRSLGDQHACEQCFNQEHGAASVFCKECNNCYCETCSASHQMSPFLSDHNVAFINQMAPGVIKSTRSSIRSIRNKTTCTTHWQPLTYICITCKQQVCTVCCVFKHMGHHTEKTKGAEQEHQEIGGILCNKIDHGNATTYCAECDLFLCAICSILHHNFDAISGHKMRPLEAMSSNDVKQATLLVLAKTCQQHSQPLKYLCKTCNKRICSICFVLKHKQHDCQDLPKQVDGKELQQLCFKRYHGRASAFCTDCSRWYCNNCIVDHQLYSSKSGHKIKEFDKMTCFEIEQALMADRCAKHDLPLGNICKTCHILICETCTLDAHVDHNIETLNEAVREATQRIEVTVKQASDYINELDHILRNLMYEEEKVVTNVKDAKQEIQRTAKRMHCIIDNHEKDMLSDLDSYRTRALTKLKSAKNICQHDESLIATLKQNIGELCQFGKGIDLVEQAPAMQEKLCVMQNSVKEDVLWKYEKYENKQLTNESLKAMLGHIKLTHSVTMGTPKKEVALAYTGTKVVSGMVVVGDCICVTHSGDDNLWLYDMIRGYYQISPVQGLENPRGMALLNSDNRTVVITDQNKDGGKLHFVTISPELNVTTIKVKDIDMKQPRKVFSSYGKLLIGQLGSSKFVVCNEEGDILKEVTVTTTDDIWSFPRSVARVLDGYVALMWDKQLNCKVQWLDQDGKALHSYSNGGNLKNALHMDIDNAGRIIIVDQSNNRIHLIDSSGRFCQFLLTQEDGVDGPMCVYLDEASDMLYLAHGLVGQMKISGYTWTPQTTSFQLKLNLPRIENNAHTNKASFV